MTTVDVTGASDTTNHARIVDRGSCVLGIAWEASVQNNRGLSISPIDCLVAPLSISQSCLYPPNAITLIVDVVSVTKEVVSGGISGPCQWFHHSRRRPNRRSGCFGYVEITNRLS